MKSFISYLATALLHLGGLGLLILGVVDSSFLFMPLGNDVLVVAMTANSESVLKMLYYAAMATAGSVAGCLIVDVVARKGGEEGLEKRVSKRRLEYVKKKVRNRAGWALTFGALMPPPFPFTALVGAAAALAYPRKKLLTVIGVSRFVRFSIEGALAIVYGQGILRLAKRPVVEWLIGGLVVVSLAGSAFSMYRWIVSSRSPRKA